MKETIIPVIFVFVVVIIAFLTFAIKKYPAKDQFDERQEMVRKNAYKYAATSMILAAVIYFIITRLADRAFAEDGVSTILIAMIGIAVFAIYSIFKDAFFGLEGKRVGTGKPGAYVLVLVIIIISNGIGAIRIMEAHKLVKGGLLTHDVMNLSLAVLFLMVLVSIVIKFILNRRAGEED